MLVCVKKLPEAVLGIWLGVMLVLLPTVGAASYLHATGSLRFYVGWRSTGVSVGSVCQPRGYQVWGDAATFTGDMLNACSSHN